MENTKEEQKGEYEDRNPGRLKTLSNQILGLLEERKALRWVEGRIDLVPSRGGANFC